MLLRGQSLDTSQKVTPKLGITYSNDLV